MVTKNTFKKKFPDVKVQKLETDCVFSNNEVHKTVIDMCSMCGFGLIYFEYNRKTITVYTSEKMKHALEGMSKGEVLLDENTGQTVNVISDKPFIVGGKYCIRIQFPDGKEDVYSCEYFIF